MVSSAAGSSSFSGPNQPWAGPTWVATVHTAITSTAPASGHLRWTNAPEKIANTSADIRVTINFGFHRRSSVLGVEGGGIHNQRVVYDDARIRERSRLIALAIDARRQRFPDEEAYVYRPFAGLEDSYRWNAEAKAGLKDYNLLDLGI